MFRDGTTRHGTWWSIGHRYIVMTYSNIHSCIFSSSPFLILPAIPGDFPPMADCQAIQFLKINFFFLSEDQQKKKITFARRKKLPETLGRNLNSTCARRILKRARSFEVYCWPGRCLFSAVSGGEWSTQWNSAFHGQKWFHQAGREGGARGVIYLRAISRILLGSWRVVYRRKE